MRRTRSARFAAFAAALVGFAAFSTAVVASAAPAAAQANAVTKWNRIAASTLAAFPPAAGGAAPTVQINMGMTQGAVYDAVNAIDGGHEGYLISITAREAVRFEGGGGRGGRVPRPREHRLDGPREHPVPE